MLLRNWTACLALLATGAWAHAHLEAAQPAADSKSAEVVEIRLAFSEPVEPKFSTIRLETGEERAVVEPAAEVDAADPKVLVVHLFEKLPPGAYKVRWAVVTVDGHRVSGAYSFLASH
ncbi:Copper resistance protein CopC (fragment) [Burkholderiales bacterium]